MEMRSIPLIARVEARSETSAEQHPVAVWVGGKRLRVERILDEALVSSRVAGAPFRRRFHVELEDGTWLCLLCTVPEGPWRVLRIDDVPAQRVHLGGW
jgi:hypothetical protein